jgi:hypothetical protein
VPISVLQAGTGAGACALSTSVSGEGRLEMVWYLYKQSISTDYHRYGNLGGRADENVLKHLEISWVAGIHRLETSGQAETVH